MVSRTEPKSGAVSVGSETALLSALRHASRSRCHRLQLPGVARCQVHGAVHGADARGQTNLLTTANVSQMQLLTTDPPATPSRETAGVRTAAAIASCTAPAARWPSGARSAPTRAKCITSEIFKSTRQRSLRSGRERTRREPRMCAYAHMHMWQDSRLLQQAGCRAAWRN